MRKTLLMFTLTEAVEADTPVADDAVTFTAWEPVETVGTQMRALIRAVFWAVNFETPSTSTCHVVILEPMSLAATANTGIHPSTMA
jgi:hypothetical protein